jgi:hypothetical protein
MPLMKSRAQPLPLTTGLRDSNNPSLMRSWQGVGFGLVVVACMALSSVVAPEHVHEADRQHPTAVVHRHLAAHEHHEAAAIDHDEGDLLWLDAVAVHEAVHGLSVPTGISETVAFVLPEPVRTPWAPPFDDSSPPHGPPQRPASLRAPPSHPA